VADIFLDKFSALARDSSGPDWSYAGWYQEMLMRTSPTILPVAYFRDEYEEVVCERLQLFRTNPEQDDDRSRDMPLPPLYQLNDSILGDHQ